MASITCARGAQSWRVFVLVSARDIGPGWLELPSPRVPLVSMADFDGGGGAFDIGVDYDAEKGG